MNTRQPLPACLKFAGMLGHTWITTVIRANGNEDIRLHTNSGASAAKELQERKTGDGSGFIYNRHKKTWRRVRPEAACLDGDE